MTLTLFVIAIWGAVWGTLGTIIGLLSFVRDRPKLSVELKAEMERGYTPAIVVDVKNRGRQATTVMEVALVSEGEAEIRKDDVTIATGRFTLGLEDEHPRVVMPGEVARFGVSLSRWPGPIHADEPLRVHAVDSHGHVTWGPALPVLRTFLNTGWQPPHASDDVLAPLPQAPIRPQPVEPRWKVWKDRELRRPSLPPPQAWPRKATDAEGEGEVES